MVFLDQSPSDASVAFSFLASLTSYGFQAYISDFFRAGEYRFRTIHNREYNHGEVTIQGVRDEEDGERTYLFIGCKKGESPAWDEDVAQFYRDTLLLPPRERVQLVYATTALAQDSAYYFASEQGIVVLDRTNLADLDREFPLSTWLAEQSDREDFEMITTDWYRAREQARWEVHYETQREITILRNELRSFGGMMRRWLRAWSYS